MPANLPSYDAARFAVGGARVFIGAVGTTPSTDVGLISPDGGVSISIQRTFGAYTGGFPVVKVKQFVSEENCEVSFEGMELNPELMRYGLGAGITTASASEETFSMGGDPAVTECALHVRHEMLGGQTMSLYVWRASGMSDGVELTLNNAPTSFPLKWAALHASTDWAGTALASKAQLFKVVYTKKTS